MVARFRSRLCVLAIHVIANELNPVATAILYATLDYPARFGQSLINDIHNWGDRLVRKVEDATEPFVAFCELPEQERRALAAAAQKLPGGAPEPSMFQNTITPASSFADRSPARLAAVRRRF